MPMNSVDLKSRISPPTKAPAPAFSDAGVKQPQDAKDSTASGETSFKDLLYNSNDNMARTRVAQKNGDLAKAAKTNEEFAKAMADQMNKENLRVPQNNLDKDAFLKLFITQMQNQDPLNPDKSSEMASQLAQFHGLEQMLNVNKNLEKMSTEQAVGRAVGLVDFVGKEVKLANGKVKIDGDRFTDSSFTLGGDSPHTSLEVRDAAGVLVATKDLGVQGAGEHQIEWDGKNSAGEKVPNGAYTFSITAKDYQDMDIPVSMSSTVKVTGVDLQDQGGSFFTEIGKVRITDVASVGVSAAKASTASDKKPGAPGAEDEAKAAKDGDDVTQETQPPAAVQPAAVTPSPKSEAPQPTAAQVPVPPQPRPEQFQTNEMITPTAATAGTAFEIPVPPSAG